MSWRAFCFNTKWWWHRVFGGTYTTLYSHSRTQRAAVVHSHRTVLSLNESGGIDYSPAELEALSTKCAGCGQWITIGSLIGRLPNVEDHGNERIAVWPEDMGFVACTRCLEMGIADAMGRWLPQKDAPLRAGPELVPFERLVNILHVL